MKIAFVLWTLCGMGGSERVVYDVARKLKEKGHSIFIVSLEDGPIRQCYQSLGIEVCALPKKNGFNFINVAQLSKFLKEKGVEVINPHHYGPLLYSFLATRLLKAALIYTEHSRWQLEELTGTHAILNRFMLNQVDGLVAISRDIQHYYLHVLKSDQKKVHLITNGIDLSLFQKPRDASLKDKLGIRPEERIVGMVAHIRPEKNHKVFLKALSILKGKIDNLRAVFVGLDCMGGEVQEYAANMGLADKTLFLGQRDDVPNLLPLFDVFCLPSLYEGLPLTLLEAMAAGVPVIASDILGINSTIAHEKNGLLFKSGDENQLAQGIARLLTSDRLREHLAAAGAQYVKENHSLDNKILLYDNLFRAQMGREKQIQ